MVLFLFGLNSVRHLGWKFQQFKMWSSMKCYEMKSIDCWEWISPISWNKYLGCEFRSLLLISVENSREGLAGPDGLRPNVSQATAAADHSRPVLSQRIWPHCCLNVSIIYCMRSRPDDWRLENTKDLHLYLSQIQKYNRLWFKIWCTNWLNINYWSDWKPSAPVEFSTCAGHDLFQVGVGQPLLSQDQCCGSYLEKVIRTLL